MKRFLYIWTLLLCAACLLSLPALAEESITESTLFEPGQISETGELSIDWSPESLDDEPYLVTYDEEMPMMFFALAPMSLDEELALDGDPALDGYSPTLGDGSYYDPRMDGITVPIRDQGVHSTCWSVAAISCAELDGLHRGLLSGSPNLSEYHLEYFARKGFVDSLGNSGRDHHTLSPLSGGNPYLSVMTLASWAGPADETETNTPYSSISATAALPDSIALTDVMHLENAYWLSMAGQEDWQILQELIQIHGGAVLCMHFDSDFYNAEHFSYHCPDDSLPTNHEVTVVGWDDNFPAAYFGTPAAGNGAWLCRNSQGTGWGDEGYFWLSYYDAVLRKSTAAVFDFGSASNYDNNYQYDGITINSHISQSNVRSYANVFTAKANDGGYEQLQAVATYTYYPGVTFEMKVYTDLSDPAKPDSGTLAASESGTFTYAGFHSIELDEGVDLYEGETFSVVFTVGSIGGGKYSIPTCSTDASWSSVNTISAGESFILFDSGNWYDTTVVKGSGGTPLNSNVRIKAYTENKSATVSVTLDAAGGTLAAGASPLEIVWGQTCGDKLVDPSREGYDFLGWQDSSEKAFTADTRVFSSGTVQAQWLRSWNDPFTDIASRNWYYGNVKYCYQHELINGIDESTFGPKTNATRGQIVTLLYRLAGEPTASGSLSFDDVKADKYYADAVLWAAQQDIILGSDDDNDGSYSFRPNEYVTRQDFLLMLYRYAKWTGVDTSAHESASLDAFSDAASIGSWALTAEKWSVGSGLQNGSDGKLNPRSYILRSEVAALLSRFDGYEES